MNSCADAAYRADQHPARLPRRRLRHLQVPLRVRRATTWASTSRTRSTDGRGRRRHGARPARCSRRSDCVIQVPASSAACKTGSARHAGKHRVGRAAVRLHDRVFRQRWTGRRRRLPAGPVREPPGARAAGRPAPTRSARRRAQATLAFLIRDVPDGLHEHLHAQQGAAGRLHVFTGPVRQLLPARRSRPILLLAGGTGLAPFLSMLHGWTQPRPTSRSAGLRREHQRTTWSSWNARRDEGKRCPTSTTCTCVSTPDSGHPRNGYVTDHLRPSDLNDGDVDVYVCGPPPMVEGVRTWMAGVGLTPRSFHSRSSRRPTKSR